MQQQPLPDRVLRDAEVLWSYMACNTDEAAAWKLVVREGHHLDVPVDQQPVVIFVLGSHDLRVADHAASIYQAIAAGCQEPPLAICCGNTGRLSLTTPSCTVVANEAELAPTTEAEAFALRMVSAGVPEERIVAESKSTNTGENIRFGHAAMIAAGIVDPRSLILVHKPYMLRRTRATFLAQWPKSGSTAHGQQRTTGTPPHVVVSASGVSFSEYLEQTSDVSVSDVLDALVGDVQRMTLYADVHSFQERDPVPDLVLLSFARLVSLGIGIKHLQATKDLDMLPKE